MSSVWDLFRLKECVAIVTGGAGKLGGQMADALAEAGAHIVVASRNLDKCRAKAEALSAAHAEAWPVAVDVTDEESVRRMIDAVMERFGRIDILVNNAYSAKAKPFEQMTAEEFESASRGALTSTFLCSQAVAPAMRAQRSGAIVNIASIYGLVSPDHRIYGRSGLDNPCNYGPAKAGVLQFTRWLAAYLAPGRHSRERHHAGRILQSAIPRTLGLRRCVRGQLSPQDAARPHGQRDRSQRRGGFPFLSRFRVRHRTEHRGRRRLDHLVKKSYIWVVVALLWVVALLNYVDRQVILAVLPHL